MNSLIFWELPIGNFIGLSEKYARIEIKRIKYKQYYEDSSISISWTCCNC